MTQEAAENRPTIARERSDWPAAADDPTERPLCVCGAQTLEQVMPMLRQASAAFAEVRQVVPTLAELNRRLALLEDRASGGTISGGDAIPVKLAHGEVYTPAEAKANAHVLRAMNRGEMPKFGPGGVKP